eukprot:CAMPEP_0178398664 /NCGR_PEP_ID=MMETSP0689_2-20121128/14888_1 /TAXON_ID=160604 /ORGANISM="Amphidinium massartii, Strain CS-259" /LENGTH=201 /DNA_ID=CAMNT_0020019431 /DNA_START=103 /DNA_END=708 /DNA_ORIENTATION=+
MPPPTCLANIKAILPQTEPEETTCCSAPSCPEEGHGSDDQRLQEDSAKPTYISDSPSEVLRVGATMLVLQNLPRPLRQRGLLKAIDDTLGPGMYNFCYMPMRFNTKECVGHAFINFLCPQVAAALVLAWDGSTALWMKKRGAKPLALQVSKYGLSDLMSLSCMKRAHKIRNEDFRPYIAPGLTSWAVSQQQVPYFEVTVSL